MMAVLSPAKAASMKNEKPLEAPLKFLSHYGELQPSDNFHYVTIHPLADEHEILRRLGLAPDKCIACDLYWAIQNRVAFVSFRGDSTTAPFVNYWRKPNDEQVPYRFVVSTRTQPLKRLTVENALVWLA